MNTTKSWFQKARAQTLRANSHDRNSMNSGVTSTTSHTTSGAGHSSDQNANSNYTVAPVVEKTLTEYLYKPATVRGFPTMVPEVVNAYNLDWWELEPFLKKTYPGVTFKENLAVEDHYLIYVPRPLAPDEREEISEIRRQHRSREKKAAGGGQGHPRVEHSPDGPRRPMQDDD
ncbi:hypothetical protein F5Y19DRAFT_337119 [Xylariaceae sp. FL1651]|nr:hypothetical protein F5Y19DRAFT_337119 [Xylariaceae sp. FL1651]